MRQFISISALNSGDLSVKLPLFWKSEKLSFYTDLQKPDGMLREQADKIVMDAIQGAIYGPWTLVLK